MKFKSKRAVEIQLLLFLCLSFSFSSYAKDIHVSKSGSNALTGRGSESKPYKTINYAFQQNLISSGDVLIVHAGTYREMVTVDVSGITIKNYNNDMVVISGANWYNSSSWVADSSRPGVYKMTLNSSEIETEYTQLFVNGIHQQIARHPNNISDNETYFSGINRQMLNPLNQKSGFAVLLNGSKPVGMHATSKVTFSWHDGTQKIPNVNFSDEAILRGFIGKLRNNIFSSSQDGGGITRAGDRLVEFKAYNTQGNAWADQPAYSAPEGFGYVMDLSLLDYPGEWFYKRKTNTIYYMPEGGTIDGKNFEIKKRKFALKIVADDVNLENINIKAATMEVVNSKRLTATNCSFTYLLPHFYRRTYGVLKEGIVLDNADNTTFDTCYIAHTWGSGIVIESGSDNTVITNSRIEDIGWMGQFTVAVYNNGNNTQMTKNTFGRCARFHIRTTESVYTKITDNDFFEAMAMGEDAGSIMFTSTGKSEQLNMQGTLIAYNKIHDIYGIPAYDTDPNYKRQKVVALYLEDVDNYTVHHNLIYNIKGDTYTSKRLQSNGSPIETQSKGDIMYLGPRNRNLTRKMYYYNNTCWNYDNFLTFWQHDGGGVNDLEFKNNLMQQGKGYLISAGADSVEETDLFSFSQEAAKAPLNYKVTTAKNKTVSNASTHFENQGSGNLRLKSVSVYNSGGYVIPGITADSDPAIGAWEGKNNWWKERVFNAGSTLSSAALKGEQGKLTIDVVRTEKEKLAEILLYPNPFKEALHIEWNEEFESAESISVRIMNINGGLVFSEMIKVNHEKEITIQTAHFAQGVYLVEIKYGNTCVVKKLVK